MKGSFWYMDTVAARISISGAASAGTPLHIGLVRRMGKKHGTPHSDRYSHHSPLDVTWLSPGMAGHHTRHPHEPLYRINQWLAASKH